jgi:uncharacterized protein YcbK (DUF882 family)
VTRVALGAAGVLAVLGAHALAAEPRFFVTGGGRLALRSVHSGATADVTYRRPDGTYDDAALARLRRVLRSRDGREGPVEPRFVELLGWLYDATDGRPLRVQSGYRSPEHNETIRKAGAKAASGSLHTEGMAADVVVDTRRLEPLWQRLRALDCCGAGYYPAGGFLHVDVGPSRFWDEKTSRVSENLSAGNARLFARTDFDRYAVGDTIRVRLHALTVPPVRLAHDAHFERAGVSVEIGEPAPDATGCIEADARTELVLPARQAVPRDVLVFVTCEPRGERTPVVIRTNTLEIVGR